MRRSSPAFPAPNATELGQLDEELYRLARGAGRLRLRVALSPQESPTPPSNEDLARSLSLTVPLEEGWALEATRMMVEHMDGKSGGAQTKSRPTSKHKARLGEPS